MNMIRPVSDLRNNFADISKTVHETAQPVFLTKNGYGDMVVLSMEAFENLQFESEVYFKLQEAEREAELTDQRYSSKDVLKAMKAAIGGEPVSYTHLDVYKRQDYYMAVRANGGVDLSTEEKQIHTNAAGETYGEALVVKYLNEDVDMISAIGKNGTEGYIKVSDLPQNIPDYVPHDHEIPVYASDEMCIRDRYIVGGKRPV